MSSGSTSGASIPGDEGGAGPQHDQQHRPRQAEPVADPDQEHRGEHDPDHEQEQPSR